MEATKTKQPLRNAKQLTTNPMKLTNYNKGYQEWADCSIHGTIYLTQKEFNTVYTYYKRMKNKACSPKQLNWKRLNFGNTATVKIINKFNIKGYKQGNYQIVITK